MQAWAAERPGLGPGRFLSAARRTKAAVSINVRRTPSNSLVIERCAPGTGPGGRAIGLSQSGAAGDRLGVGGGGPAAGHAVRGGGFDKRAPNPLQLSASGRRRAVRSVDRSKAKGFAPEPHQRALPSGLPPRASPWNPSLRLVDGEGGACGVDVVRPAARCRRHALPPPHQPIETDGSQRLAFGGAWAAMSGPRGAKPPGGVQGQSPWPSFTQSDAHHLSTSLPDTWPPWRVLPLRPRPSSRPAAP